MEALHRREQVQHAREALRVEREKNLKLFALETRNREYYTPIFVANLCVFRYGREHPARQLEPGPEASRGTPARSPSLLLLGTPYSAMV